MFIRTLYVLYVHMCSVKETALTIQHASNENCKKAKKTSTSGKLAERTKFCQPFKSRDSNPFDNEWHRYDSAQMRRGN